MDRRVLVFTDLEMANPRIPRIVKRLPAEGWPVTLVIPETSRPIEEIFLMGRQDLEKISVDIIEIKRGGDGKDTSGRTNGKGFKRFVFKLLSRPGWDRLDAFVRKQYWRWYVTLNYPEPRVRWIEDAYPVLRERFSKGRASVLLTSSSPITVNLVAFKLKKEFGMPGIAEFRDLWSLNHNSPFGPIMRTMDKRLEKNTMRNVDAMVTMTEEWAQKLKALHRTEKVSYIPITYDRAESPTGVKLTSEFTLTYTGAYYEDKQDPFIVLESIKDLISEGTVDRVKVKVRFYGTNDLALRRFAVENGLDDVVVTYPRIKRAESLRRQMESQVLLYFNWEDEREKGVCSLKLIEYLFSGRPILLTAGVPDNLMASVVMNTKAGRLAVNKDELKSVLTDMYNDYLRTGAVPCSTDPEAVKQYDVEHLVKSCSRLLSEMSDSETH